MSLEHESLLNDVTHFLSSSKSQQWSDLVRLIRQAHKANPYESIKERDNYLMWQEQCGINFPLLYIASVYLYIYAQEKGCDTFLFATRDCCHWYKVFHVLFPHTNAHYFHCSRNMFERATEQTNQAYNHYVKSLIKTDINKTIFVDIHGTGQRAFNYFKKVYGDVPYCFLLSASCRNYKDFPSASRRYIEEKKLLNIVFDARGSPIEMLNYDIMGTLQDFNWKQTFADSPEKIGEKRIPHPLRDPLEYRMSRLESYHTCIDFIINHMEPSKCDFDIKQEDVLTLIRKVYRVIQDNKPVISKYIMHPAKHKKIKTPKKSDKKKITTKFQRFDKKTPKSKKEKNTKF